MPACQSAPAGQALAPHARIPWPIRCLATATATVLALALAPARRSAAEDAPRTAPAAPPATMQVAALAWLGGCWEGTSASRVYEELWTRPAGGTLLGLSRTVKGDRTTAWEQMRIEEKDGRLVFTAQPSGQDSASFTAITLTATEVVFANPAHDFPQRVLYRLLPDGGALGRIEGLSDGKPLAIDFPLRRAACPGPAPAAP